MTAESRSERQDANERLARLEIEQMHHREMLGEIKDAILGIRDSMASLARLEERQSESNKAIERAHVRIDREGEERVKGDKSLGKELADLRKVVSDGMGDVGRNAYMRFWIERTLPPLVTGVVVGVVVWMITR